MSEMEKEIQRLAGLVTGKELAALFSVRLIRRLRLAGLRTIGNSANGQTLYRQSDLLDAIAALAVGKERCQRVPASEERGRSNAKGHKVAKVATNTRKGGKQPVSKHDRPRQMGSLVQDFRRTLDEEAI